MCVRVFCASYQPLCIIGHSADSDCKALRHKTEDDRTIFIMHLGALQGRARDALCFLASNGEGGLGGGGGVSCLMLCILVCKRHSKREQNE